MSEKIESGARVVGLPALMLILGMLTACGGGGGGGSAGGGGGGSTDGFDRQSLLASIGERVLIPAYERFDAEATELENAIGAYCTEVRDDAPEGDQTAARSVARAAWRDAMDQWQIAEAIQVGPVAMNGNEIHDNIYSWPVENTCSVDRGVVDFEDGSAVVDLNVDQRGMSAIAYLLHAESLEHSCSSEPAQLAGWNDRDDDERELARCDYAEAVAVDVRTNAGALVDAWDPADGNYLEVLTTAGDAGSEFATAQEAVNVVSDAMFYFEQEVKEMKLGTPLGIFDNGCGAGVSCPEALEGLDDPDQDRSLDPATLVYDTEYAKEMMRANFIGFQRAFHGGDSTDPDAVGFDDFLIAVGEEALADEMASEIQALIDSMDEVNGTLGAALEAPIEPEFDNVEAVYQTYLQPVSIKLRNQFLSLLGLEAPASSASDTD